MTDDARLAGPVKTPKRASVAIDSRL